MNILLFKNFIRFWFHFIFTIFQNDMIRRIAGSYAIHRYLLIQIFQIIDVNIYIYFAESSSPLCFEMTLKTTLCLQLNPRHLIGSQFGMDFCISAI